MREVLKHEPNDRELGDTPAKKGKMKLIYGNKMQNKVMS
jgi:hypothetical protein